MRKEGQFNEIQPMSPTRKWVMRAATETIGAIGLGFGIVGGHEAVMDHDVNSASNHLLIGSAIEVGAAIVIMKQLTAETENKEYLQLQRSINRLKGTQAALHYHTAVRKELIDELEGNLPVFDSSQSESPQIPEAFRNAFKDFDESTDSGEYTQ
ncbi:MAG: hypothetical protein Q7T54_02090 [Candidatus Levybacteria bacterium]|nr:hypothetical protein [Candidatus Levybacteria bacterium]